MAIVAALALGGIVLGAVTLGAAAIPLQGGLPLQAAGVAAAVGLGDRTRQARRPGPMNVAVVGSLSLDRVDGGEPRVGGCPFYAARALRAFGTSALIVAKCAESDRATLLPPLSRLGLPVLWRDSRVTAGFSIAYNGERRRMTIDASPIHGRRARWTGCRPGGCTSLPSPAATSRQRPSPR